MPTRTNRLLPEHVLQHFIGTHQLLAPHEALAPFLERQLFFITLDIKPGMLRTIGKDTLRIQNVFSRVYYDAVRTLYRNHLGRKSKRDRQPLGYAFVDYEDTRSGGTSIDVTKSKWPHIHALLLVRNSDAVEFLVAFQNAAMISKMVSDYDVQFFNSDKGPIAELISYCMKGYQKVAKNFQWRGEYEIYPR